MFSLQIFTELLIVGSFLILGILPLLMLVNKQEGGGSEFWPLTGDFNSKVKIVVVLLLAYAAGAAGNRLVDDFWEDFIGIEPDRHYGALLKADLARPAAPEVMQPRIVCGEFVQDNDCLKVALMVVRERSDATRDWLDSRRAYIRLMRSAALASILFVLSVGIYKLRRRRSQRFKVSHVLLAAIFMGLLSFAHWEAENKYWKRVYELYLAMPAPPAPPPEKAHSTQG